MEELQEETLAQRVRRLRLARGMSQEQLARKVGVTKTQVYLVESGRTPMPRPDVLRKYARILGISVDYLRYGYEPEPPGGGPEWPPLEVCLRHTSILSEDEIAQVARIVRALESEQRREMAAAEGDDEDE